MSPLRNEYENNIRRAFSVFETGETEPADIKRWRDDVIVDLIPEGSKVLDFGCGRGDLLYRLIREKRVFGQGIERDLENVYRCLERKIAVFQINFEKGLQFYGDGTFDYVILEDTIQTLNRPAAALREMLRIGTYGIITCPNFGHWRVRRFLAEEGRMPKSRTLPYEWYDTPNIHLCTVNDIVGWIEESGLKIAAGYLSLLKRRRSAGRRGASGRPPPLTLFIPGACAPQAARTGLSAAIRGLPRFPPGKAAALPRAAFPSAAHLRFNPSRLRTAFRREPGKFPLSGKEYCRKGRDCVECGRFTKENGPFRIRLRPAGLEPARKSIHQPLKLACLPISPRPHLADSTGFADFCQPPVGTAMNSFVTKLPFICLCAILMV